MVVSDKFIFLHLQKCGGSFVRDFMLSNVPGSKMIRPQHDGYTTIKGNPNKPIVGIIRNPWDWYVSEYYVAMSYPLQYEPTMHFHLSILDLNN